MNWCVSEPHCWSVDCVFAAGHRCAGVGASASSCRAHLNVAREGGGAESATRWLEGHSRGGGFPWGRAGRRGKTRCKTENQWEQSGTSSMNWLALCLPLCSGGPSSGACSRESHRRPDDGESDPRGLPAQWHHGAQTAAGSIVHRGAPQSL